MLEVVPPLFNLNIKHEQLSTPEYYSTTYKCHQYSGRWMILDFYFHTCIYLPLQSWFGLLLFTASHFELNWYRYSSGRINLCPLKYTFVDYCHMSFIAHPNNGDLDVFLCRLLALSLSLSAL